MATWKKIRPPEDRLTDAGCRRPDVDPNWWTTVHHARVGHKVCQHALARHICRFHCPVRRECLEDEAQWGANWDGMVIGGELRMGTGPRSTPAKVQPSGPIVCRMCIES